MKITKKVLVTDDVHESLIYGLKELGYLVNYQPDIAYNDIFDILPEYDGIIINSKVLMTQKLIGVSPKLAEGGRRLKFIARLGSGLEIIDLDFAKENNISVFSAPEGNRNAVAEHAVGMLLALSNQLIKADYDVRNFQWNREARRGFEIEGKTIGIIGFGNNGSCFAEKLSGFGVKILAFDKFKQGFAQDYPFVEEVDSIDEIQKLSDVISLHVPLDTSTHYLVNENFISKCKEGVIIVNSARGKIIHTIDLINALESGQVGGACLDVFENEKTTSFTENERVMYKKLYEFNNVIFSPHIAGWTHESKYKIANSLLKQISNIPI